MATFYSPRIVTDGLVLHLDAANNRSFVSGSTTWFDLSGNRNTGSLVNGPTYSSSNNGSIVFDGTNDYVATNDSVGNFGNSNFTIYLAFKTTTNTNPATFIAKSIGDNPTTDYGWLVNQASVGSLGFAVATVNGAWGTAGSYSIKTNTGNLNDGNWKSVAIVVDRSQADVSIYINGATVGLTAYVGKASLTTLGNVTNTRVLNIASESDVATSPFHIAASISLVQLYNRALSAKEVRQNYNATKGRYGLL